jgi:hypothetical protein
MAVTDRPPLLDGADAITCGWLQEVLACGGHPDAVVTDFRVARIGAGNVGDTVRIALGYADPGNRPASLVGKFRCSDPMAHAHGIGSGSYLREVESYRLLARHAMPCRTPRVLWVDGGAETINLVMEDLGGHARPGNQVAGCSLADAHAVVAELARLHRAFYPMQHKDAPGWALRMADVAEYWSDAIARALPIVHRHAGVHLTAAQRRLLDQAAMVAPAWYTLPVPRATLTHGDPRVDNVLFLGREAVLLDWQMTGWRNPMHDVGYFLSGSIAIEDRRAHEHDLLKAYAGIVLGQGMDTMIEDYRVHLLSGLMTTVAAYSLIEITPPVADLLLALLLRNLAAAQDWNALAAVAEAARNW